MTGSRRACSQTAYLHCKNDKIQQRVGYLGTSNNFVKFIHKKRFLPQFELK
jgi:hypothetical protein